MSKGSSGGGKGGGGGGKGGAGGGKGGGGGGGNGGNWPSKNEGQKSGDGRGNAPPGGKR